MSTALQFGFSAQQIVDEGRTTWEDIGILKTWLKTENLPKLTDEQIVIFLLSCLNEQEPTRTTIKAHYRAKARCPEMFDNRTTKRADVQKLLNTIEICCFPERTEEGYCVASTRLYDTYFRNLDLGPMLKIMAMNMEAVVYDYPPTGLVCVFDMKGSSIMHLTRLRLGLVKSFLEFVQEGLTVRLKKIHIINTTYFIDKLLFLVKPFLKQEVIDLITFHPPDMNMELFYETCLPRKCLPEDYGGDLPSFKILHQQSIDKLESLESYFEEEELQRRDVGFN